MRVAIMITNPNHHLEMTMGVALRMKELGHDPYYVSLCEMRRMRTPVEKFDQQRIKYYAQKAISEELKPSSGAKTLGSNQSVLRNVLRKIFWYLKIRPFVTNSLKSASVVLLMNDAAFPGNKVVNWLNKKKIPFCLLQEGIRFPLPGETESSYGSNGARKLFAWGERSANYFKEVIQDDTEVVITGSPRFDEFSVQLKKLNKFTEEKVLGVFTNPIDDQGFCSKQEKLDLFERFVVRAAPYLKINGVRLGLKCHPREDIQEYVEIANRHYEAFELDKDIRIAIASVDAGVIMASTVGLELLAGNKPIGQLEIPEHGWVFDYIDAKSTLKIPFEGSFDLSLLFDAIEETSYFREHILIANSISRITDQVLLLC